MEGSSNSNNKNSYVKMQSIMGMEVFDCAVCSSPLGPLVFRCSNGDFLCSICREKLPAIERLATQRCLSMERVVDSIFVPCKHGCNAKITYYQQQGHQDSCPERPRMCKCPVSGCGFVAAAEELFDHLTAIHRLPWDDIKYFVPFKHDVRPGIRLLRGGRNKLLFLLELAKSSDQSLGHVVPLTFVRPNGSQSTVGCSTCFFLSCSSHHYQVSKLDIGPDVASKQMLCVVPDVSDGEEDCRCPRHHRYGVR